MGIGQRITDWIEERRAAWGDSLGTWLLERIGSGLYKGLADMEPGAIESYRASLESMRDNELMPPELREFAGKALETGNPFSVAGGMLVMALQSLGVILGGSQPIANLLRYQQDKIIQSYRFDPATLIDLIRRRPEIFQVFREDLAEQGWTEVRLQGFDELVKAIPPLADMVRFADFSAFDPEVIAKWQEYYTAPEWLSEPFRLAGITNEPGRDWANKYWFSHFRQPGRFELDEIYRRGLLGDPLVGQDEVGGGATEGEAEESIKLAYRTQGFSQYWQDRLLQLVREVPTRVDVRRWWDMRTIDEAELRSIYKRLGYFGRDLDNYVLWTKVYVAFPDLMSRWANGWLSLDEVRSELVALGMPAERVEEFIQAKTQAGGGERTSSERDLTKTDIYKGVKQERITREEGLELLVDLGYSMAEADYLLDINAPQDETVTAEKTRELTKTDIINGLRSGVLSEEEALSRLLDIRYSPTDAELLLDIFRASVTPPAEDKQRQASKADIVEAVKKGLITPKEGYLMLQDIGFTPEASEFILEVRAESSPFSPITFGEFKDLTAKWRKAAGMTSPEFNAKLREKADELVKISDQVKALEELVRVEESQLIEQETTPVDRKQGLTESQVALNRAKAEQARVQGEYQALVAEFKQVGG